MTQRLDNPFPLYLDTDGQPLQNGYVYMGVAGQDPEAHPIATFWNKELTIAAKQPFRTRAGFVVNGANPAFVYASGEDYSIRVRDVSGGEIFFLASTAVSSTPYQPLDSDLTAIAALATTAFGRNLLTLANQGALKAATGIPDPLPLAGGNVTGSIGRQGAGAYVHHVGTSLQSGRLFNATHDAADPTSIDGDILLRDVAP